MKTSFYVQFKTVSKLQQLVGAKKLVIAEGNKKGNVAITRTEPVLVPNAEDESYRMVIIPTLSGESFAGRLRRELASHLFDTLGIDIIETYAKSNSELKKTTFHAITSGGALYKESELVGVTSDEDAGEEKGKKKKGGRDKTQVTTLELQTAISKYFPMLSLLGGNIAQGMIQGKLAIGNAVPMLDSLVGVVFDKELTEQYEFINAIPSELYVNDGENLHKSYRSPDFYESIKPIFADPKKNDDEGSDEEEGKGNPFRNMPTNSGYVLPGVPFLQKYDVYDNVTEVELGALGLALKRMATHPILGGKAKYGFGRVKFNMPDLDEFPIETYENFITKNKDDIYEILTSDQGMFRAVVAKVKGA